MRRQGTALEELHRKGPATPQDGIWVPERVDLVEEQLVWRSTNGQVRCREQRPGTGLLASFLQLQSAQPKAIKGFAKRWGPLGVRATNLPSSRTFPWRPSKSFESGVTSTIVQWPEHQYTESVAEWRAWSAMAHSLLRICASLRAGKRGLPEDWNRVQQVPSWQGSSFDGIDSERLRLKAALEMEWGLVVFTLQEWIARGGVRPNLHYKANRVPESLADRSWRLRLTLGGNGLLGALAVQLVTAASRSRGVFLCDDCGKEYRPTRNPNPDRAQRCAKCNKSGAAQAAASQRYYAKNKLRIQKQRRLKRAKTTPK